MKFIQWIILCVSLAVLIYSILINRNSGLEGVINLQVGRPTSLSVSDSSDLTSIVNRNSLNLILNLDSVMVHPHPDDFEILLRKRDASAPNNLYQNDLSSFKVVNRFSFEPMKIRKVEKTELRFRLKNFFPDFTFDYRYPENRDSIEVKAPGITLEIDMDEEPTIVTLREDQPGRNKIGDIVNLGSSLLFYWEIPYDSIMSFSKETMNNGNKIVFSGSDHKVYFLFNGTIEEQSLKEHTHYKIPGREEKGFTILYCFPDIAFLQAVPSSLSPEPLNPVANIEIWKPGEGAKEAFIYPQKKGRSGGDYFIPDSDYKLSMGIVQEKAVQHCDCVLSVKNNNSETLKSLRLLSGNSGSFHGYRFKPLKCDAGAPGEVEMKITRKPGNTLVIIGTLLSVIMLYLIVPIRKSSPSREIKSTLMTSQ